MTIRLFLAGVFCLAWSTPVTAVQLLSPQTDSLSQVGNLLAQANHYASNESDSRKALALYSEALSLEGANSEILWLISRSYVDIGKRLPAVTDAEKQLQLSMYEKALEFASKSVEINPASSMAYTHRAIARAHVALFKGFWESVSLLKDVREDLEKSLELDDSNDLTHFVLGTTHLKVIEKPWIIRWPLGLGWGSREEALRHFQAAVDLRWDVMKYRMAAARLCIEEEEFDHARAHLSLVPLLQPQSRDDTIRRNEALLLLQNLEYEE